MAMTATATARLVSPRALPRALTNRIRPPHTFARRAASTTSQAPSQGTAAAARSSWRTAAYASLFLASTGLFAVYYFDSRSAIHRYILTPVLRHTLDPETSHKLAVKVLASGLSPRDPLSDDPRLNLEIWGEQLSNPIGLAAGFDKNGEAIDGLFNLGFAWVEIGSVTPKPQPGNPKPRVFHLPADDALINRYGFPSDGHAAVLARLRARLPRFPPNEPTHASLRPHALLAINLGKNKASPPDSIADFVTGVRTLGPLADVLVVNVSSPNTPGLRGMQSRALLEELLKGVTDARDALLHHPRVLLKIAPDLDDAAVDDIAAAVRASAVDGVIVSNTTVRRPASLTDPNSRETGGLSGAPLKPYTLATLRALRARLPASIPLIACGGVAHGADALEYARAGARAVQLYTSFGYAGAGAPRRIKDELAAALAREGRTWMEVVRAAEDELSWRAPEKAEVAEVGTVRQLIEEAEELKRLLDGLGARMEGASVGVRAPEAVSASASASA